MYDCYNNIIGFSANDCDCISENRLPDYDESESGLFLDGLTPIAGLLSVENCDENMWSVLEKARTEAVISFVKDTNALMLKNKQFKFKRPTAINQSIGEIKSNKTITDDKNYAVVRWTCCPIRGGFIRFNNLGTIFTATGAQSVDLYSNVDGFISTHVLNTTANLHKKNTVSIELPLYSKYVDLVEYYFVFQFQSGNMPKGNEINCGCGGWKPSYNYSSPYFYDKLNKFAAWANYVMIGGGQINSLTELDDLTNAFNNKMYGLVFDFDLGCKVDEILCKDSIDFTGNPLALSMAYAILYKTAANVANKIIKSPILTKENMVGVDEWDGYLIEWQEKYNEHANYIAVNADITANDCLTCGNLLEMTRQGLFA